MHAVSPGQVFAALNILVLPAWGLLLFAPRWRFTRLITAYLTCGVVAFTYVVLMFQRLPPGAGFLTIDQMSRSFQDPWIVLAAFAHYLALDVFTGAWMVRDSLRLRIPHLYVVPCLALTFAFGPAGLLAYFGVRAAVVRRWPSTEAIVESERLTRGPIVVGTRPAVARPRVQAPRA
jgi:hypothetical protein